MQSYIDKTPEVLSQRETPQQQKRHSFSKQFIDNRPETSNQRKFQEMANNASVQPIQKQKNNTGLPDDLKAGIENLSGYSMDDVKVHRNSAKPAQLQAHAYAQGTDIHLAPGQDKHLPHEAWHVVQQKQGRVKPTLQMKGKININGDAGLEKEADLMGEKALQLKTDSTKNNSVLINNTLCNQSLSYTKQLKESTTLKPGGLNMIGETHSDYSGKDDRGIEANKIRSVLGTNNKYYTEGMLKTEEQDSDYADPIYLRLEQVFGFILDEGNNLIPRIKKIDLEKLNASISAKSVINSKIKSITQELAPSIASKNFKLKNIIKIIKRKKLTKKELERLGEVNAWNLNELDPTDQFEDNFYAVQDKVDELAFEIEEDIPDVVEIDPFIEANVLINLNFFKFYENYKGRLPSTLKLYYDLKKKGHTTTQFSRFNFDIDFIPPLLKEWEKIEELKAISQEVFQKQKINYLPLTLTTTQNILEKLIRLIREGQNGNGTEDSIGVIKMHRSIKMNQAAESLKNQNIAWKVGNLHVEDIKFMEKIKYITPGYTYINKENFKAQIAQVDELDDTLNTSEKLGASYLEAKKTIKDTINNVDEDLANS